MQERGWRGTFLAPPATPPATWAEDGFVPLETLAVRRGPAMPLLAWALQEQRERLPARCWTFWAGPMRPRARIL